MGVQVQIGGGTRELSRTIERTMAKRLGLSQRAFREAVSKGEPLVDRSAATDGRSTSG
jgi:hypothetical protein